jgi:tetratricopeptide (TPR) repeat protein
MTRRLARSCRVAAIGLVLAGATDVHARELGPEPVPSTADEELAEGQRAYERGDYPTAVVHFRRAYERDPSPLYLYPWAQAARQAGDCESAIDLYERFIDSGARGDAKAAAESNLARCRETLAEQPSPPEPDPIPTETPPPPEPSNPSDPSDPPPTHGATTGPRRVDGLGVGLLVAGGVSLLTGVALIAIAESRRAAQAESVAYDRFDELDPKIDRLHVAGGVTLGVGALLTLGGTLRLVLVGRRRTTAVTAMPTTTPAGGPMLGFVVRVHRTRGSSVR